MTGAIALAALSLALVFSAVGVFVYALCKAAARPTPRPPAREGVGLDELRGEGSIRHYVGGGWRADV